MPLPWQKDQQNPRYGKKLAARRVARAVMLGSAPTSRSQSVRGIEASRVRLGIVQPGEAVADFNDALNTLQTSLAYLYTNSSGSRFWYDTRPTLRKTVEDRATQIAQAEVEHEIETRLGRLRKVAPFAGVHLCPASSLDVPDEQSARLVVLHPAHAYAAGGKEDEAMQAVEDFLNKRGTGPRIYRNMLAFLAPDKELLVSLKQEARRYLAWLSVKKDSVDLNLDAAQNRDTAANLARSFETVDLRMKETWCWLLVPYIDRNADQKTIIWESTRLSGGTEDIVAKAARKMAQSQSLISTWSPALLLMELDNVLWKTEDSLAVRKLWDYLCTYCYLPRLAGYGALEECIRAGVNSTEYFAYAAGVTADRLIDLKYNQPCGIEQSGYLVKLARARRQIEAAQASGPPLPPPAAEGDNAPGARPQQPEPTEKPGETQRLSTRFYMSATLDATRINRDVQRLVEEVLSQFTASPGVKLEVSLEVDVQSPGGISQKTVRDVSENCRTLKVKTFGFDE